MDRPVDAFDAALAVAEAFEAAGTPYAIGGAIAYALWGPPRGTMDVDVNLFVEPDAVPAAVAPLAARGVTVPPGDLVERARGDGMLGEDDERVVAWDRMVAERGR